MLEGKSLHRIYMEERGREREERERERETIREAPYFSK
jgi:hypothetical protein